MPTPVVYLLFFLSGATGLVYELVWVRELIFVFGGTTYAITTVLVAFMAGLGLGSYSLGRACHRLTQPGRVYGCLEIAIGLYAVLVPFLLRLAEPAYRILYPHVGQQPWLLTAVRVGICVPIVLVPATCMGATLPVLVRHVTALGGALGRSVGRLYGINTLGAVLGTLAAGFWLIPAFGLTRTTWFTAAVNVLIGATAVAALRRVAAPPLTTPTQRPLAPPKRPSAPARPRLARRTVLTAFAVSGFAAMVYQITWTRALVMSLGSSTYAFTCILAAFILGLAIGSLAVARWVDRWQNPTWVFGILELLIGLVAVAIVPIHGRVPYLVQAVIKSYSDDYAALLRLQFLLVIAVTFVPTFMMGAIFPLVTRMLAIHADDAGAATGRAYAVNTLGTIIGSFLAGFVLIRSDTLGVQNSIVLASVLNGVAGLALVLVSPRPAGRTVLSRVAAPGVLFGVIAGIALIAGRWNPLVINAGPFMKRFDIDDFRRQHEVVYVGEGVDLTVAVVRTRGERPQLALMVNGKPDASTAGDTITQLLLGHVPGLMAPDARSACVIGLGSGMTLGALGAYDSFQRLDCAEISEEVIKAATYFAPYARHIAEDPRVRMIRADGRNHLLLTDQHYDVIVSEPSNPWMSGVANLFTREFFELCRQRLTERGVLAVWLQSYTMSVPDFRMIVRTLFEAFPHVSLWQLHEGDRMLLASCQPLRVRWPEFERRFSTPAVRLDLYRVALYRPAHILGRYVAADEHLRAWVADAPVHTDDNALLEFSAPRFLYRDQGQPIAEAMFRIQRPVLEDLLDPVDGPWPPGLQDDVARVLRACWACTRAVETIPSEDVIQGVRYLLDAYRGDPSHLALRAVLQKNADNLPADLPEAAALKAEVAALQPPLVAPIDGKLSEIAAVRRHLATLAVERNDWTTAIDYLTDAASLEPDDRGTLLQLAWVLMQAGQVAQAEALLAALADRRPGDGVVSYARSLVAARVGNRDQALLFLAAAVESGDIAPAILAEEPEFISLREDPRFRRLIEHSPATQTAPATAP